MNDIDPRQPPLPAVLLVDDDVELLALVADYLRRDGFVATLAHDGATALTEALGGRHDIVVLDVMMPGQSGIEVLRQIRAQLEAEDDYVAKPCSPRELAARLRAILRRLQPAPAAGADEQLLRVGALTLRPARRTAAWGEQALHFTGAEFNVLELLMRQAGRLVTKQELSERGLGRPLARFDRSIDVHISSIRQKLAGHAPGAPPIKTVRGMGYQLTRD